MSSTSLYLEIGQNSLKILDANTGLEVPLERSENGRLAPSCREKLTAALREFLKKRNRAGTQIAHCAIGARGVSLRRLTLPSAAKDEFDRLLLLQIESEFPLEPDELAWGFRHLSQTAHNGAPATQELLVAAVKKDLIEDYAEVLEACGLQASFSLAALARSSLCVQPPPNYAVLDIGRNQSELISFENGLPAFIRITPWGGDNITRAIESGMSVPPEEAERLKIESGQNCPEKLTLVINAETESLAAALKPAWIGQRLYLTGKTSLLKEFRDCLPKKIGSGIVCERLDFASGDVSSSAIAGLQNASLHPPLVFQTRKTKGADKAVRPAPWKWVGFAALLIFASLSLRYAEGFLREKRLAKNVSEINAYKEQLPIIDRELNFLQYLQTNQPPYMDAILTVANAMPGGLRIDSLSMNRRGEVSLKGSMRDSQQVIDFRTKLIESGFFLSVVVEEQTPTPDRQKVNYRMIAQWKPLPERKAPPVPEPQSSKPSNAAKIGAPPRPQMPAPVFPQ